MEPRKENGLFNWRKNKVEKLKKEFLEKFCVLVPGVTEAEGPFYVLKVQRASFILEWIKESARKAILRKVAS